MSSVHFTFIDYFLFSIVFIVSILIALYFAFKSKRQQSVDEYFFGGKKFGLLPISLSLLATCVTGSTTIGQTMEAYAYGLHNGMNVVALLIAGLLTHSIFLPIFYELQLKSSFMYLELRFDRSVRLIASSLFVLTGFFVMPLAIYVPALSFQEVTGLNLHVICIVSGCLCIFYTAIGGFKAVVWTDAFQFSLIIISSFVILFVGLGSIGGFQAAWDALDRGGRLNVVRSDLSLTARGSMWAYLSSSVFIMTYHLNCTQSSIQRFLALPTLQKAQQAVWIQCFIFILVILMHLTIGAAIYAIYEDCDPFKAGTVGKIDQIFSHFVQEKASLFQGFNGIYIAGSFSAGLSTASTLINTLSGTIYVDFLSGWMKYVSQRNTKKITKILVIVVGVIGIGVIFIIERMGTIFAISIQCFTISTIGVFGLFCSGIIFKNINSKGAKCGVIVAMVTVGLLIVGNLKKNPDPVLHLRIDGCDFTNFTTLVDFPKHNSSVLKELPSQNSDLPWILQINFQFFCIIGFIITILVGSVVSFITGGNKIRDQNLFAQFLRKTTPEDPLENHLTLLTPN